MKAGINPWAFLRPLLLAVAATAAWIALSATGASADSPPSRDSLVGAVGSSLDSATLHISHQAKDVLEPVKAGLNGGLAKAPAASVSSLIPSPTLAPVVTDVTTLTDQTLQSIPVVNNVAPSGTVSTVAAPVVGTVDQVVASTVDAVAPLTEEVLAPLDPVVKPVAGALLPPPVTIPQLPVLPGTPDAVAVVVEPEASAPAAPTSPPAAEPLTEAVPAPAASPDSAVHASPAPATAGTRIFRAGGYPAGMTAPATAAAGAGPDFSAGPAPGNDPIEPALAAPASTTGGAGSSGGNGPAVPAWLTAHHFQIPTAGTAAARGSLLTAPAPVSFDTGSSPD